MSEAKNRERGLKAAISNPRVSEEAKQHDRELLASEFGEHMEQAKGEAPARRRSSAGKKSASAAPPAHPTEGGLHQGPSSGIQAGAAVGRQPRRASSGDTGLQLSEEKERANV
jgi:hypothetical protein